MKTPSKKRLDHLLVERGLADSRQRAQALILAGDVLVDQQPASKAGAQIAVTADIIIKNQCRYVSRGGQKLEGALQAYPLDPHDRICLDVGASTGGFTDCLLQHGAAKVYAVDVGYGQLAWKLRQDERVVVIERANIRHLSADTIDDPIDVATIDVSFISLKIVIPAILKFMRPGGRILALIKPQFEVGKGQVGKGGVVRDPEQRQAVVDELNRHFQNQGLSSGTPIRSPITGPKGNVEFFNIFTLDL